MAAGKEKELSFLSILSFCVMFVSPDYPQCAAHYAFREPVIAQVFRSALEVGHHLRVVHMVPLKEKEINFK